MAKIQKTKKACPANKVRAEFKLGDKVYEVCAVGKRPVVRLLTQEALARRTRGQALAAAKAAKKAAAAARAVAVDAAWEESFAPGAAGPFGRLRSRRRKTRRSRRR